MSNRYREEDGEILVSSVHGKGSLAPGNYHVLCERWDEVPEGVFAKFIVQSGPIKGAAQACVIPPHTLETELKAQNEYELTIGLSDGVVLSTTATGYRLFSVPDGEVIIDKPSPMSAILAVFKANPDMKVAAPEIKKVRQYEKDIRISNSNEDNTEDASPSNN